MCVREKEKHTGQVVQWQLDTCFFQYAVAALSGSEGARHPAREAVRCPIDLLSAPEVALQDRHRC